MKVMAALIVGALSIAGSALAQTPAAPTQQKTPAQHQPGVAAPPAAQPPGPAKTPAPAADVKVDPAEEAAIRHLMDITQTTKLGDNIRLYIENQLRTVMARALPADQVPKFMDTFNEKISADAPTSAVIDASVPIYARAFSKEDIDALIQFYESPLGQRVVKALPQVSQQSEQAGMQIEQKAAMDALHAMTIEYPQLEQMMQPPPDAEAAPDKSPAPQPAPQASPEPKPSLAPPPQK